jgi:uncharacterized LabA/DUF88 family protein
MQLRVIETTQTKTDISKQAAWIIDAAYLFERAKACGTVCNIVKLKAFLERQCQVTFAESHYVTSIPNDCRSEYRAFLKWLTKKAPQGPGLIVHPYNLRRRTSECEDCNATRVTWVQKSVDVAIAMQLVEAASKFDDLVLLAGDADFVPAVEFVKRMPNKRITVVAFTGCVSSQLEALGQKVILLDRHFGLKQKKSSN